MQRPMPHATLKSETSNVGKPVDGELGQFKQVPSRLFVLDNSVVDDTGHHLEYVRRIAYAVGMYGVKVVLLANRAAQARQDESLEIVPTFTQTFWDQYTAKRSLGAKLRTSARKLKSALQKARDRFYYRHVALIRARIRALPGIRSAEFNAYTSRVRPVASSRFGLAALYLGHRAMSRLSGYLSFIKRGFNALFRRLLGPKAIEVLGRIFNRLCRDLIGLVTGLTGLFFVVLISPLLIAARLVFRPANIGRELLSGLRRTRFSSSDNMFVPTAGVAELDAVLGWLGRSKTRQSVSILFRREIYRPGDIPKFALDASATREVKSRLVLLQDLCDRHDIRLLVDTLALAEQYRNLTSVRVEVLPIPVGKPFGVTPDRDQKPPLVLMIGDARTEKGFQFVPDVVQHYATQSKIQARFRFQSNYADGNDDHNIKLALSRLKGENFGNVELSDVPLSPEDYTAWLSEGSVVLAPYDPDAYSVRSSGVFAEALACGLPVITSCGSWMDQVAMNYFGAVIRSDYLTQKQRSVSGQTQQGPLQDHSLLLRMVPEIPFARDNVNTAHFKIACELRRLLGKVNANPDELSIIIGYDLEAIFMLIRPEVANASGFATRIFHLIEGLHLRLDQPVWHIDAAPHLGEGVRIVPNESRAICTALDGILRRLDQARLDSARAQDIMEPLWSHQGIASGLLQKGNVS
jgi:glycosyltransferase involved in cell wall biosynthesis